MKSAIAENAQSDSAAAWFMHGLVESEAVERALGISSSTLARLESKSSFPPALKLGRRNFYSRRAVERWIATRTGEKGGEHE